MDSDEQLPKVSVIIPTYNRSRSVCRAVESAIQQTYENIEIIVVDDGSTDGTEEVIKRKYYGTVHYIWQSRRGAGAARNRGFRSSKGKYVNFLDSDDYFLCNNIKEKVDALEKSPKIDWVFSDRYYVDEDRGIYFERIPILGEKKSELLRKECFFDLMLLTGGQPTQTGTVLMRRECVEKVQGWDESLPTLQDVDFFLRVSMECRGKFIDRIGLVQIKSPDSLSTDINSRYKALIQLINKINTNYKPYLSRNRLQRQWRKWQANALNLYASHLMRNGEKVQAMAYFKKSICCYPCQKRAYVWLLRCMWR
jgi:glycosyltransferase involved in cell wall biosynthesis